MADTTADAGASLAHDSDRGTPSRLAAVRLDGQRLVFEGALDRAACAGLWKQLQPMLGTLRTLDLKAVSEVDSAGLALLAEVSARSPGASLEGAPEGLAELRAAYRLDPTLGYAT